MPAKIYVTRAIPESGLRMLQQHNWEVAVNPEDRVLSKAELLRAVAGRDAVLCLLTDRIDAEVVAAADRCRVFSNYATGYNNIDLAACRQREIIVTNTPGVLTDACADYTWALLLASARRVVEAAAHLQAGAWTGWGPLQFLGADLAERTLGIVGAGRIGTAVALRSAGFRMRILYTDRSRNAELEQQLQAEQVNLARLLAESDFVSLHVPLNDATRHLIGARQLQLMKPGAILINTSRGPVVDEQALVSALQQGVIAGAGLDVFEDEPRIAAGLLELPNVVACPHIASATHQTRDRMAELAAGNLIAVLTGREPIHRVA